jgi:inhibitor of KinA
LRAVEETDAGDEADDRKAIDIPVCYDREFGPDLADVAAATGLAVDEVVRRHTGSDHRVLMIGFAPGFPYLGGLDAALVVPRRGSPRARVEAGSVAVANGQTAIYPFATPGGWNVLGRTPLRLFDPLREPASLLQAGDRVRFVSISAGEFQRIAAAAAP